MALTKGYRRFPIRKRDFALVHLTAKGIEELQAFARILYQGPHSNRSFNFMSFFWTEIKWHQFKEAQSEIASALTSASDISWSFVEIEGTDLEDLPPGDEPVICTTIEINDCHAARFRARGQTSLSHYWTETFPIVALWDERVRLLPRHLSI